jgi:glycosyltransferase involved in cell wall biosynthesis
VLSLCVIARDEADRIGRCLRSVPIADERIVIVDDSTTDGTAAIAESLGAQVIRAPFPGHVAQKNRALSHATGEWIVSLDADEWLDPRACAAIVAALASPGDAVGFSLARCSEWSGRPLRHGRWFPDRKVRVARRDACRWVGDDPHDRLEVAGPVVALPGEIRHTPYRDLAEHVATIDRYSRIHAESLAARGVRARPWDPLVRPVLHFVDAALCRRAYKDGPEGLTVAMLGAVHVHLKWARLRAIGR